MFFTVHHADISLLPPPPWDDQPSGSIWPRIFVFFLLWWIFYWLLLRLLRREAEYCCRAVTLVHGIVITCLTLTDIILIGQEFDYVCNTPLTPYQIYFLSVTFSYFMYDLAWMHMFGTESVTVHLHHVCSILLLFKILVSDTGGPGVTYGLLGLEFTNPYLQARWFLRTHGYNNTPIHTLVELWFMFLFIIVRVLGGTTLLYYVEIHPGMDILVKVAFIGMYVVSWLLTVQILQFFKRKYYSGSQPMLAASVLSIFPYRRGARNQVQATQGDEDE